MMSGFFKNRVVAWSKEEAGGAPVVVQARRGRAGAPGMGGRLQPRWPPPTASC